MWLAPFVEETNYVRNWVEEGICVTFIFLIKSRPLNHF